MRVSGACGSIPTWKNPGQDVTISPALVKVAPANAAAFAVAPPQVAFGTSVHVFPLDGALSMLRPPLAACALAMPAANRRSVLSGITTSARPPFPAHPLATV